MLDVKHMVGGSGALYLTTMPNGAQYAWRLLTLKEYRAFDALRASGSMLDWNVYVEVFNHCYSGDAGLLSNKLPAGTFASIGEFIMWMSGDSAGTSDKEDLIISRNMYNGESLTEHMRHIIHIAFPAYTIEDLDCLTRPDLFKRFAYAEALLVKRGIEGNPYEPLDLKNILSPEEQAARANKPTHGIDFQQENQAMAAEGFGGEGLDPNISPLDMTIEQFSQLQQRNRAVENRKAEMERIVEERYAKLGIANHLDQLMGR